MTHDVKPHKPNPARMHDHFLGGKHNFAADREAANKILRLAPGEREAATDSRRFLGRAVRYLAASGVRQFLDIGSGLPTRHNTHQVAARADWMTRTAYVDNDPVTVSHATEIIGGNPAAITVNGDLTSPAEILQNNTLNSFLDLSQPLCLVLTGVLHYIPDTEAYAAVDYLKHAVAPGSALVISHATADGATSGQAGTLQAAYHLAGTPIYPRTRAAVTRYFTGFNLIHPGVTGINDWGTDPGPRQPQTARYAGVAGKPAAGGPS